MAVLIRHLFLFFTLILLWILLAKAHPTADTPKYYYGQHLYKKSNSETGLLKNANAQFEFQPKGIINEEFQSSFEPFRTPPRRISQRAAFQNLDLYTARGYGKRSDCGSGRICRKKMDFSGARLYGKRNAGMTPLICLLTDCSDINGLNSMMVNQSAATKLKDYDEDNSAQDE